MVRHGQLHTFEFIPEPSSFLLAALGAISLAAFLRRKRA
jgi:hypothetical protein